MLNTANEVKGYILAKRLVDSKADVTVDRLQGGVSCNVWKITAGEARLVLKQALHRLNVEAEWYSDVTRIYREEKAMRFLESRLPADSIPKVIYTDQEHHLYVMTCAPEDAVNWKSVLLEGHYDPEIAAHTGSLLSTLHKTSLDSSEAETAEFADTTFFKQLRIEPFYEEIMHTYSEHEQTIQQLIQQLHSQRTCLVHGDFSPKNLLVDPRKNIIVLDFEVAHWGNPLFDVAFMVSHLILKGWAFARQREAFQLITSFMEHYGDEHTGLLQHIGLLILSRLDGKSPVNYIHGELLKKQIRTVALKWLQQESNQAVLSVLGKALKGDGLQLE